MHRLFCKNLPPVGGTADLEAREKEHIFKVFRARSGDRVELLDGCGSRAAAVVTDGREIEVIGCERFSEPDEKIYLCCALPRRQKCDQLLKQAVEMGVWAIQPIKCERSVAEGGPRERWDLLLREACKQSGNLFIPEVRQEEKLADVLKKLQDEQISIYYGSVEKCAFDAAETHLKKAILIGPEGGFSPAEIDMIRAAGGIPLNLAPNILRLETAAIAAVAVLRWLCLPLLLFLLCGCDGGDISRNPLMLKAEQLRTSGDFQGARRFLRQAVARYPENPEVYLALGKLCDEELGDNLEALFGYRSFLQLAEADDGRRESVKRFAGLVEENILRQTLTESQDFKQLKQEKNELQRQLNALKKELVKQQLYIIKLNNEKKKAAVSGRVGRKRR